MKAPRLGTFLAVRIRVLITIAALLALAGCNGGPEPKPTRDAEPETKGSLDFANVETVASGLRVPWEIAFVDETTILVTERPGRVRVVRDGRLDPDPVAEIDVDASGEAGLLGIALHPDFPDERFAYVYYTSPSENRVSRFPLDDSLRFGAEEVIVDGIPAARVHDGGRIAFGPDDMLYIGTGDAGNSEAAADRESPGGKILRVNPDGSVPDDNPFEGSPIYSYGHRNIQGFDWDSEGKMYASEHGPTGEFGIRAHDEINVIEGGSFYGWPFLAGSAETGQGGTPIDPTPPLLESEEDTWAPAGLAVHEADGETLLLVANLRGERLMSVNAEQPDSPQSAVDQEGRLRAARFGPDDCLYLTTSNTDGRGTPLDQDDRILRICPPA